MTIDPLYTRLRELSWRRRLTPAEQAELHAWLAAHPEARADWAIDAGLDDALGRLPNAPLASNFTARVLQTVQRDAAAHLRHRPWHWHLSSRLRWLPRAAVAAVILATGFVSYREFVTLKLSRYGESVAAVSNVASLPAPDVLRDFDAIRAMNRTPSADEDLLAALQ